MQEITDQDQILLQNIKRHPKLRNRIESLLNLVEDADGDFEKADAAELQVIEELRHMGNETLTAWAERGIQKTVTTVQSDPQMRPAGKKTSTGTRRSVK